jgi:DNA-directed RNA polymerase specialized sigma subunit
MRSIVQTRCADRLVEHYLDLGLVRRAAKRMARTLPCQVDPDELLSAGAFGLLAAVERFEPTRADQVHDLRPQPISGAMVDYLREIDHLSRVARSQANQLSNTTESLKMNLGRPPGEEEDPPAARRVGGNAAAHGPDQPPGHQPVSPASLP